MSGYCETDIKRLISYSLGSVQSRIQQISNQLKASKTLVLDLTNKIQTSEKINQKLQKRIANLQSWKQHTLTLIFSEKTAWKINANNFIGVLTTYPKNNQIQGDIRFQAHNNKIQILTNVCFKFGQINSISFTRGQQNYSAQIDWFRGKLTGKFTCSGKIYPFTGDLIKQTTKTTIEDLTQKLQASEKINQELRNRIANLQSWQQVLTLHSIPRQNVQLDLNNPRLKNMKIDEKTNAIDSAPIDSTWTQIVSKQQVKTQGKSAIILQIEKLIDDEAQVVFGLIKEQLRTMNSGCWGKQGTVLFNRHHKQGTLIYKDGHYQVKNIPVPPGSKITMLIDKINKKVSWYLNGFQKLGEEKLPEGKLFLSLQFYKRSLTRLL